MPVGASSSYLQVISKYHIGVHVLQAKSEHLKMSLWGPSQVNIHPSPVKEIGWSVRSLSFRRTSMTLSSYLGRKALLTGLVCGV